MEILIRGVVAVLTFLALWAGSSVGVAQATPNDEELGKAVVKVEMTFRGNVSMPAQPPQRVSIKGGCSAVFVGNDGDILTAAHCVHPDEAMLKDALIMEALWPTKPSEPGVQGKDAGGGASPSPKPKLPTPPPPAQEPEVELLTPEIRVSQLAGSGGPLAGQSRLAEVVAVQGSLSTNDHALLHVYGLEGVKGATIALERPKVLEKVWSAGFPGSLERVMDDETTGPSYKDGTVSAHQTREGVPYIQVSASMAPGMSGGPTFNEAGEVVGLNSFGVFGGSGDFNFITDTEVLRRFLEMNGVKLKEVAVTPPPPGPPVQASIIDASGAWLLAIGLIVIFATTAYLALRQSSRTSSPPATSKTT